VGLHFEEIEVGSEFTTASRTIGEADIEAFAALTGDRNPLHMDEEFAREGPFGSRIAHGPLVLALAIGLVSASGFALGTALGMLALEDWRFLRPVRVGDTITVHFAVTEKRPSNTPGRGVVKRLIRVVDQTGAVVQEGSSVILVRTR
jgi:3-hydroxybutyryl-CoA dehydratase